MKGIVNIELRIECAECGFTLRAFVDETRIVVSPCEKCTKNTMEGVNEQAEKKTDTD